jgi:ABC-2 type transport system ATP-binding protein
MSESIISVKNFSKSFGDNKVVTDLSFDVQKGEVFALLGANGSGKTTTIRCLLNILQPDSGTLLIDGKKYDQSMSAHVGYLPEERGLYTSERVIDTMVYFGELKGMSANDAKKWSYGYLEKVGLHDKARLKVKKLSSGQQQKIQLGITIINQPDLLILDEPTKGLDPVNRTLLMDMLLEMKEKGSTIIFITHQMEEVEKIANRLIMIQDGKRILYGAVDEVKAQFGEDRIHVQFRGVLPKNDQLYSIDNDTTNSASLILKEGITPKETLSYLANTELKITKFEVAAPSLEEIFVMVSKQQ